MKREVKIGIFAVAMIALAWAGIRFLQGFDLLRRNAIYYAAYDQINGVQPASPVMMKGVKIGSVTGITLSPSESDKVILQLTIQRRYPIPKDSEAKIFSDGLLGSKAIEIIYGKSETLLEAGDTLRSGYDLDLMSMAGSELDFFKQKFSQIAADLSRTLGNLNRIMEENAVNIAGTLGNLNTLTGDAAELLKTEKKNLRAALDGLSDFSKMLGDNAPRIDSIVGNLNNATAQLAEGEVVRKFGEAAEHLSGLLARIEKGEGTAGKLINDSALYDSLDKAIQNLSALLVDLKQYPGRYVHLSVFGRDADKAKAKADRKAAKAAQKAERDSLKQLKRK